MESVFNLVDAALSQEASFLNNVSQEIWKNPELKFEEKFAHKYLTDILEDRGFEVQRSYVLPTAFRAVFDSKKAGPTVITICEYDALPGIGHACGHNLIAEAGLGAALGIKAAMEANPDIPGKVVVLGTPAEEGGAGKITLIKAGGLKGADVALMVHPGPCSHAITTFIGINRARIKFFGKAAHASGFPWEGVNALDAAVACYNNISLLRQQTKPTCRIHAIITDGGKAANIIPEYAELMVYVRAGATKDLRDLKQKVFICAQAGANASGCRVEIEETADGYKSLITNRVLAERFKSYAENLGAEFDDGNPRVMPFIASTDMGDVSHEVPSIHPTFTIGTKAPNHSTEFTKAAGNPEAQTNTLIAAKSMALLALDVMTDAKFLLKVKEHFADDLREDAGLEMSNEP